MRRGPWALVAGLLPLVVACDPRGGGDAKSRVETLFDPGAAGAFASARALSLAKTMDEGKAGESSLVVPAASDAAGSTTALPPAHFRRSLGRIAIDPGHGGSDPGAVGFEGTIEKDVTLDVARRVAPVLSEDGIAVMLTRSDDHAVPLEERTALANAFGADLFISLHCNATENRLQHGVETYVLDTARGAITNRIAARENAAEPRGGAELASLLASMRMADQAIRSTHLADLLQRAAIASLRQDYAGITDRGVQAAGFHVLVGARMPAVLFEMSFLSHARDEERLGTEGYRSRLADGIVNAVRAYREGR